MIGLTYRTEDFMAIVRDLRMWLVVHICSVVWGSPLAWSCLVSYFAYPQYLNLSWAGICK